MNTLLINLVLTRNSTIPIGEYLLFLLFLIASISNGNASNVVPILQVGTTSNRYEVDLEEGQMAVELCGLIPHQNYSLSYASDQAQAISISLDEGDNKKAFLSNQKIHFTASTTCRTLYFKHAFKHAFEHAAEHASQPIQGTLSIGVLSGIPATSRSSNGIQTDVNFTSEQLIKDIFIGGDCFEVKNIHYSGDPKAIGFFDEGKEALDISRGVMLSTGDIANAHGPNISTRISTDFLDYYPSDKDLESLLSSNTVTLEDVAVLEFDFTPTTNRIQFQYSFASEEYCDYVGSKFNDVFGFFLSGPGIKGSFEKEAVNIAFVPGTTDFVAINNINHLINEEYFVNNVPEGQIQFVPCKDFPEGEGVATDLIEFDGFTTVLTAVAEVVPCQTYHIKLTIADASDALFDSAVFLKANSFNAGGAAYVKRVLPDITSMEAFEGCKENYFLFERTDEEALADSLVVHFKIAENSTAVIGEDYEAFPDSVIIPAGEKEKLLPIILFPDNIQEGTEHLILELESACSCADLSIDLPINDFIPLTAASQTDSICGAQEININPNITGGVGMLTYDWTTGDTSANLQVHANTSTTFQLTVTDGCANSITSTHEVIVLDAPMAYLSTDQTVCDLDKPVSFDIELDGLGPWTLAYAVNGEKQVPLNIQEAYFELPAPREGVYELLSVSNESCTLSLDQESVLTVTKPEETVVEVVQPICAGDKGFIEALEIRGGTPPYAYSINNGKTFQAAPFFGPIEPGFYKFIIQDANACEWDANYEIVKPEELIIDLESRVRLNLGDTYRLDAALNQPISTIQKIEWLPATNLACATCLSTEVRPLATSTYELQVTDERGCMKSKPIDLIVTKNYKVYVPSAFSPNGDGENDLFYINAKSDQIKSIRQFQVVNRWGDLLYQASDFMPNDPTYSWDGRHNGQPLNAQVLAYFVEIEFIDGEIKVFKGDVTLVDTEGY